MPEPTTRDHIVDAADRLFYERGFDHTSFADIADEVKISRGNFYYHFKSKDEILSAVIDARMLKTQAMLDAWTAKGATPAARLQCFSQMLIANRQDIKRFGCPVGTLCSELSKLDHPALGGAGMVFGLFRDWLARQFADMGAGDDADALAMHLLARSQGVAALANAFHDEKFIRREVGLIAQWIAQIDAGSQRRPTH
jgi:TetR/AcrR family transcriptional regulator, transcriptional repressor for nem operon